MIECKAIDNITIYLPKKLYNTKCPTYLYGKCIEHEKSVKFFIISGEEHQQLELIGVIDTTCQGVPNLVRLTTSENFSDALRVKEVTIKGVAIENLSLSTSLVIVYDGLEHIDAKFKTHTVNTEHRYDVIYLATLLDLIKTNRETLLSECWIKARQFFFFYFISVYNVCSMMLLPLRPLLTHTAVFRHFRDWIVCIKSYSFDDGKVWTLAADISAGILVLTLLLQLGNPGDYIMHITEIVVKNLKSLLASLKGSPVGLKLNVLLNHFFLNCFIYHVELWHTFLKVLAPVVQYLTIPLAVLGLFGLSFQLAMLSDLLILISLHAYCFYIYAAVLYRIEVIGIKALWRVVLGRRKNVLRSRVESHEYMARQLFLATMFFAALLFLLPTVLVYYAVFASLRFGIYCITYLLMTIRKRILVLPVYTFVQWIKGSYACPDAVEVQIIESYAYKPSLCKHYITVLRIESKSSLPWTRSLFATSEEINHNEPLSIGNFLSKLIKGEMMGFIQPEQKIRD